MGEEMTRDEILNMEAGPEIDMLVGKEVLHLSVSEWNKRFMKNATCFSTDSGAAFQILDALHGTFSIGIHSATLGRWLCKIIHLSDLNEWNDYGDGIESVLADTLPLAICRAALVAVMETK